MSDDIPGSDEKIEDTQADGAGSDVSVEEHDGVSDEGEGGGSSLDQSEIDSFLGEVFSGHASSEETGIERVIKAGFVSYERLPILESVFERFIRIMSSTLRNIANENVEVTIVSIRSMRFGDCMNSVPSSSLFSVFKAIQWGNYGIAIIDSSLAYSIIDILMGGTRGFGHSGFESRSHTAIERSLIEKLVEMALNDLSVAFSPVCAVGFAFERLEVSSRFVAIARASHAVVMARFHIDMDDRSGNMDLLIPYATLEPVRDQLSQQFMGEKLGNDSIWENHLISEILETDVEVSAVFDEKLVPLSKIMSIRPGTQITFPHIKGTSIRVTLQCGQTPLFSGRLGQMRGNAAVKIENRLIARDKNS